MKDMKESTRLVLTYLKNHPTEILTAPIIAERIKVSPATVNGIVTAVLQRNGYAYREDVAGYNKKIIRLTDSGKEYLNSKIED